MTKADFQSQLKSITPAQQEFVLSHFYNKIYQNPATYGLQTDGVLRVGDKFNFSKLLADDKEVQSVFKKAQETITPNSDREKTILSNKEKTITWIKEHPDESVTNEKVNEILNTKPKPKIPPEFISKPKPLIKPMIKTPLPPQPQLQPQAPTQTQLEKEVVEAKQRLATLEGKKTVRTMVGDVSIAQEVETAFRSEVNSIYGKKSLLGLGKTEGVDSKEWIEMAGLPAAKVVEYCTGDSAKSGLPEEMVKTLSKSKIHQAFLKQMIGLMEESDGAVKPFQNENVEQFIKRIGGYLLKTHLQKTT